MINGIVIIHKEPDYTSHDVVAKMRGICGQKKVGHTGTLDPMALIELERTILKFI